MTTNIVTPSSSTISASGLIIVSSWSIGVSALSGVEPFSLLSSPVVRVLKFECPQFSSQVVRVWRYQSELYKPSIDHRKVVFDNLVRTIAAAIPADDRLD